MTHQINQQVQGKILNNTLYWIVYEIKCVSGNIFLSNKKDYHYGPKELSNSRKLEGTDRPDNSRKWWTYKPCLKGLFAGYPQKKHYRIGH